MFGLTSDQIAIGSVCIAIISALIAVLQFRDSKKPAISTWITIDPLDTLPPDNTEILIIKNSSSNQARSVRIRMDFIQGERSVFNYDTMLRYLNPNETTKIQIPLSELAKSMPDNFHDFGLSRNRTRKVPKKTLNLDIKVKITCDYGILPILNSVSFQDDFCIEWRSTTEKLEIETSPLRFIWHKRDGHNIENIGEAFRL